MDEPTIKALQDILREVENVFSLEISPAQHQSVFEALEFALKARVVACTVHVISVDSSDGPRVGTYHKCRLRARIDKKNITRTIVITSDPLEQLLRSFGDWSNASILRAVIDGYHGYKNKIRGIQDQFLKDIWEDLGAQLAVKRRELDEDEKAQADFKRRFDALKEKIFQKDFDNLRFEMARLQRRGWNLVLITSAWNEALVQGVMES